MGAIWKVRVQNLWTQSQSTKSQIYWGHLDSEDSDPRPSPSSEVFITMEGLGQYVSGEDLSPYVSTKPCRAPPCLSACHTGQLLQPEKPEVLRR